MQEDTRGKIRETDTEAYGVSLGSFGILFSVFRSLLDRKKALESCKADFSGFPRHGEYFSTIARQSTLVMETARAMSTIISQSREYSVISPVVCGEPAKAFGDLSAQASPARCKIR